MKVEFHYAQAAWINPTKVVKNSVPARMIAPTIIPTHAGPLCPSRPMTRMASSGCLWAAAGHIPSPDPPRSASQPFSGCLSLRAERGATTGLHAESKRRGVAGDARTESEQNEERARLVDRGIKTTWKTRSINPTVPSPPSDSCSATFGPQSLGVPASRWRLLT